MDTGIDASKIKLAKRILETPLCYFGGSEQKTGNVPTQLPYSEQTMHQNNTCKETLPNSSWFFGVQNQFQSTCQLSFHDFYEQTMHQQNRQCTNRTKGHLQTPLEPIPINVPTQVAFKSAAQTMHQNRTGNGKLSHSSIFWGATQPFFLTFGLHPFITLLYKKGDLGDHQFKWPRFF
eukprot:6492152-Amphidinium_carterae.4